MDVYFDVFLNTACILTDSGNSCLSALSSTGISPFIYLLPWSLLFGSSFASSSSLNLGASFEVY